MRKLVVSEFITLDGVIQAPGGADEDRDGGFKHGGWTQPYWHDDIGKHFMTVLPQADALLLGRRTYVSHAAALEKPTWRNTTIIRDDDVVGAVRRLKAQPGKTILTDGSTQLVHLLLQADLVDELHLLLYPLAVGGGKRLFPEGVETRFTFKEAVPYPSGVVGLHYIRADRPAQ